MRTDILSHLYDDAGPFASVYVEVSRDATDAERTADLTIRQALDDLAEQGAPESVNEAIRERLEQPTGQPAPISRSVVASERGVLLDRLSRRHLVQPLVSWGRLPDLADWLVDASAGVGFVLALVDHEGADVSSYTADGIDVAADRSVGEPSDSEHKVKRGGWSQLNWQRSAEAVWNRNAAEAAAEIERQVRAHRPDVVILAGEERSRSEVADQLGSSFRPAVVVLDRAGRAVDDRDDRLAADVESVLRRRVVARRFELAHRICERLGQDTAVATGIDEVADAFVRGQVEHLVIDRDELHGQEFATGTHPGFALGAVDAAGTLPADQALIAAAVVTGAKVDVAGAGALRGAPVVALLRGDQASAADEG